MHAAQLDRLRRDSHELQNYIHKLNKKGKNDLAYKLLVKQEYLNQQINELDLESQI